MPLDRCRQHVAVIRIGQFQDVDQILEIADQSVAHMRVHQVARALQPLPGQVIARAEQRVDPLIMDGVRPFGPIEIGYGELQQEVAQRRRVKDRGIKERRETAKTQYPMPSS